MRIVEAFERAYADWALGTEYHNYSIRGGWGTDDREYPVNRVRFVWEWLLDAPGNGVRRAICSRFGHDLEDAGSYAGPDTAADMLECRRCGWGFTHVYY